MTSPGRGPRPPRHPAENIGRSMVAIGVLIGLGCLVGFGLGQPATGALALAFSTFLIWGGAHTMRVAPAAQLANMALNEAARGDFDRSRELLDAALSRSKAPAIAQPVELQRALLALHRAELRQSLAHLDRAIAMPLALGTRAHARLAQASALATRAFVRAALDDAKGAREDAASVLAHRNADAACLARVRLAEAMLLRPSPSELGRHLTEHSKLMLEFLPPRERMLTRALRRLASGPPSVYRTPAEHPVDHRSRKEWADAILPGAGELVEEAAESPEPLPPLAGDPASVEPPRKAKPGPRMGLRVGVLWGVLVVLFLAIWQFLPTEPASTDEPTVSEPSEIATTIVWLLPTFFIGLFLGLLVFQLWRQNRIMRDLAEASRGLDVEGSGEAREVLMRFAEKMPYGIASSALVVLARDDERHGELERALAHCEHARDKLNAPLATAGTYDLLLPGIRAQKARLLAALGRESEALAELGLLERAHPAYALLESARRSVHLILTAKRGDFATSATIARSREDELSVSLREETLGELTRLASGEPFTRERRERLRNEIDERVELRRWLERAAPSALGALAGA